MNDYPHPTASEANIMIVDDTPANLHVLSGMLNEQGYLARPVPNARLALQAAIAQPPDLILMDVMMPDMNGYEACRKFKETPALKDIPIIFISALSDTVDKVKAFASGGVDYITKPFHFEEVRVRVENQLKIHRLQGKLQHQNTQLADSYKQLKDLEQLRDDLVNMVVHDMRSPLTVMNGYLFMLKESGSQLTDKQHRFVNESCTCIHNLMEMVSSLLDVSKMENQEMTMVIQQYDLTAVIKDAVHNLGSLLQKNGLTVNVPEKSFNIPFDHKLMVRVFGNLLGNAVRFSPKNGTIDVRLNEEHGYCNVEVTDEGKGIPPEAHERVFEKFGQVEERNAGNKYSTGLGLAFCKLAVESHGGTIGVKSEVGRGSTFWLKLPKHPSVLFAEEEKKKAEELVVSSH